MNEGQLCAMIDNIRNDIATYTNGIERNNEECDRLSTETTGFYKSLNNLMKIKYECTAELDVMREVGHLSNVRSINEVCKRCGAVKWILIDGSDDYRTVHFCDDCIDEMRERGELIS